MKSNLLGFWASVLALLFGLGYSVAQLLSWLGVIPHPQDLFWLFLPSLFLAPAFLVVMICLHYRASEEKKTWTLAALSFAIIYCGFATLNYFTQLTVVVPKLIKGDIDENNVLAFKQGSFMFAVDCLGYFFMSLSTSFAAFAFYDNNKKLYWWMLVNGALIVIFIPAYFNPFFYFIGSVWAVTFTVAMMYAARFFRERAGIRLRLVYEDEQTIAPETSDA